MIFERDDKGLLHQVELTLEEIAAAGRNLNLTTVQTFYVLFTPKEEAEYAKARAEAAAKQKAIEDERLAQMEARKTEQQIALDKKKELMEAQKQAEKEKDKALALAFEQIQRLNAKIEALSNPTGAS